MLESHNNKILNAKIHIVNLRTKHKPVAKEKKIKIIVQKVKWNFRRKEIPWKWRTICVRNNIQKVFWLWMEAFAQIQEAQRILNKIDTNRTIPILWIDWISLTDGLIYIAIVQSIYLKFSLTRPKNFGVLEDMNFLLDFLSVQIT